MATTTHRADTRTPAQWYALLVGATLVLVGLLGFVADSGFDTGGDIQGDELIVFEVNGWHNLVHIASGLFLLAVSPRASAAKGGVLAFGLIYGLVTIIGMVDGETVLGLLPVNGADNILHLALSVIAIAAALASDSDPGHGTSSVGRERGGARNTGTDADTVGDSAGGNASASFEQPGATRATDRPH